MANKRGKRISLVRHYKKGPTDYYEMAIDVGAHIWWKEKGMKQTGVITGWPHPTRVEVEIEDGTRCTVSSLECEFDKNHVETFGPSPV